MKREEKNLIIDDLTDKLNSFSNFYLADISCLNAEDTSDLRRKCFEREVKLMVVKNTLLKKAFEKAERDYQELYDLLKDSTSIMFTNSAGNAPAKVIKEFRKQHDRPILKAAFVEESLYIGDEQVEFLSALKSKDELVGDVILILQSPAKSVISGIQASGGKLAGILKTLSEKSDS
jgi:large subunit ribosomal protein L10